MSQNYSSQSAFNPETQVLIKKNLAHFKQKNLQ